RAARLSATAAASSWPPSVVCCVSRQNKKLQYAVLAAAALHGGTEPDLLGEVAWWQEHTGQPASSRPSPTSAPLPAAQTCRCTTHARTWPSALATQRHNDQSGRSGSGHLRPSCRLRGWLGWGCRPGWCADQGG